MLLCNIEDYNTSFLKNPLECSNTCRLLHMLKQKQLCCMVTLYLPEFHPSIFLVILFCISLSLLSLQILIPDLQCLYSSLCFCRRTFSAKISSLPGPLLTIVIGYPICSSTNSTYLLRQFSGRSSYFLIPLISHFKHADFFSTGFAFSRQLIGNRKSPL